MSVVEQWRDRARALRAEYWRCSHCRALSSVRRAVCALCGDAAAPECARLPATLKAAGWSHAHIAIENLDQTERMKPVMLLELPSGRRLPLPLAESESRHASKLVGTSLRVVLRRTNENGDKGPIAYGRKVAADPATRIELFKKSENTKREIGNG